MRTSTLVLSFLCAIVALDCSDGGIEVSVGSGTYQYVGYLSKSMRVVHQGWFAIVINDSTVTGEWQFNNESVQQLEGTVRGQEVFLNMNPRVVDNNLFLRGTMQGRTIRGTWSQVGFPGVMAEGTFVAERK